MRLDQIAARAREIREAEERAMFGTPEPEETAEDGGSIIEALLASAAAVRAAAVRAAMDAQDDEDGAQCPRCNERPFATWSQLCRDCLTEIDAEGEDDGA